MNWQHGHEQYFELPICNNEAEHMRFGHGERRASFKPYNGFVSEKNKQPLHDGPPV